MKGVASTALAVLAAASCAENSAAFLASGGGAFLRQNVHGHDAGVYSRNTAAAKPIPSSPSMSLMNPDKAVADAARTLATFMAGAAVLFSSGGAALADGSTTKFSLPPVSQAKDRW